MNQNRSFGWLQNVRDLEIVMNVFRNHLVGLPSGLVKTALNIILVIASSIRGLRICDDVVHSRVELGLLLKVSVMISLP